MTVARALEYKYVQAESFVNRNIFEMKKREAGKPSAVYCLERGMVSQNSTDPQSRADQKPLASSALESSAQVLSASSPSAHALDMASEWTHRVNGDLLVAPL